jgi:hypothetical protein
MKEERPTWIASKFPFLSYLPPSKSPSLHSIVALSSTIHSSMPISFTQYTNKQNFLPILTSFLEVVIVITILEKQTMTK